MEVRGRSVEDTSSNGGLTFKEALKTGTHEKQNCFKAATLLRRRAATTIALNRLGSLKEVDPDPNNTALRSFESKQS